MTTRTRTRAHVEPILSARDIVNRFGKQVVHDKLSLDIAPGEIIGIAGGSGSGKSVLLKTFLGLHQPDAGEVLLNGKAVQTIGAAEKAALFGVLFQQHPAIFETVDRSGRCGLRHGYLSQSVQGLQHLVDAGQYVRFSSSQRREPKGG